LAVAPSTVAPTTGVATTMPPAETPARPVVPTTSTTLPVSPLAAALGEPVSVIPAAPSETNPPVRLAIDSIGVDVAVRAVGVTDDGQLEVPDETEVGWYRLGSSPGEPGAAVIAGHVNWNRVDGPFVRLRQLEPGSTVVVSLGDGSTRTYQVVERQQYAKTALPADRIWTQTGPETLVLVTCGGSFNPDIRRYRDNIVVYAVPVA
jgi:LPXTG-site transpeptidase (sortase) family protein